MNLKRAACIAAGICLQTAQAVDSLVDLTYSQYQGKALGNGVTQWLGMRYAAPPVGDLRFVKAQDPATEDSVQDATKWALPCLSTGGSIDAIGGEQSEDCLFINVFAPSNATSDSKLPIFFFMQGGGFNSDSSPYINGSDIIPAAEYDMILVTVNYRVGPYGFLVNGDEVTPNIGLLDQRKALEWVQSHISAFGGNPDHVVIGGDSAGGASVTYQLGAYGGKQTHLFHGAAAESSSFATMLTVEEAQFQYDNLAIRLGCAGAESLACLRSKSAKEMQEQNVDNTPYPGASNPPLWLWNPVVDGDLIQDVTYQAFKDGKFVKVPVIFGDDTNGGSVFTPRDTSTLGESDQFLKDLFPFLTLEQIGKINDLYPNQITTCPSKGCYWHQLSASYGDMRYMCPAIFQAAAFPKHCMAMSYAYRYNVEDPDQIAQGIGVPHVAEMNAIFGPGYTGGDAPASYYEGGENAKVVPVAQAYWTSFVRTLDPNTHRYPGSAKWETWTDETHGRIVFQTGGETEMESVDELTQKRCDYIISIGADIRQ